MTETELMPRLVGGYTELGCGKLKKGKGLLGPNFGVGLKSLRRTRIREFQSIWQAWWFLADRTVVSKLFLLESFYTEIDITGCQEMR